MTAPLLCHLSDRCCEKAHRYIDWETQEVIKHVARTFDILTFLALLTIALLGATGTLPLSTGAIYTLESIAGIILLLYAAIPCKEEGTNGCSLS